MVHRPACGARIRLRRLAAFLQDPSARPAIGSLQPDDPWSLSLNREAWKLRRKLCRLPSNAELGIDREDGTVQANVGQASCPPPSHGSPSKRLVAPWHLTSWLSEE